jgi:UDP-4-amino-4,6-dideoxy-N-acetyl-beta-L-altrosamine N-acetyltransferase
MHLDQYGVILERLTSNDIELVRQWRNDPKISQYMFFREDITPEMQKKWFVSINNDCNFYFIINHNNEKIGLTEIKKIDYKNKIGESGIFIYEEGLLNSLLSYQITLSLLDFAFYTLKLKGVYSTILKSNKRAIRFNKSLGFHSKENIEEENSLKYYLCKEDYEKCTNNIKKIIIAQV